MTFSTLEPPPPISQPWPDFLNRRLLGASRSAPILSLAADGRILIAIQRQISIIHPPLLFFNAHHGMPPRPLMNAAQEKDRYYVDPDDLHRANTRLAVFGCDHISELFQELDLNGRREAGFIGLAIVAIQAMGGEFGGGVAVLMGEGSIGWVQQDGVWQQMLKKGGGINDLASLFPWMEFEARNRFKLDRRNWKRASVKGYTPRRLVQNRNHLPQMKYGKEMRSLYQNENRFICFSRTRLLRPDINKRDDSTNIFTDNNQGLRWSHFVLLGSKDATIVRHIKPSFNWYHQATTSYVLHHGWTKTIACLDMVPFADTSATLVAVGGTNASLSVYKLWLDDADVLRSSLMWDLHNTTLFGPVTSLSWAPIQGGGLRLRLAVGCGNSMAVVDWGIRFENLSEAADFANPCLDHIVEAHDAIVSSVQILGDDSIVSCGMDGALYCWTISSDAESEINNDNDSMVRNVQRTAIHLNRDKKCPCVAMQRTLNALGVITVTSSVKARVPVHESDNVVLKKYAGFARRTLVGIYIRPPEANLENAIESAADVLRTLAFNSLHVGQPVSLWDLQLFIDQIAPYLELKFLSRLTELFFDHMSSLNSEALVSEESFVHVLRVLLAFGMVLVRFENGRQVGPNQDLTVATLELQCAILTYHYHRCLSTFVELCPADQATEEELQAINSMMEFVRNGQHLTSQKFSHYEETISALQTQLEKLGSEYSATYAVCDICFPDEEVAMLPEDGNGLWFTCPNGDRFKRCVLTGLPMQNEMPLICHNCSASALKKSVEATGEMKEFKWLANSKQCPLCMGVLSPFVLDTM